MLSALAPLTFNSVRGSIDGTHAYHLGEGDLVPRLQTMQGVLKARHNTWVSLRENRNEQGSLLLTLGAHARGLQYLVCVSVCVSVTQHLTFHVIIRATNDTNLSGG